MESDKEVLDGWCMYEERSAAIGSNSSDSESIEIISEDEAGNYQIYSKNYFNPDKTSIADTENKDLFIGNDTPDEFSNKIDNTEIEEHCENDPIVIEEGMEAQEKEDEDKAEVTTTSESNKDKDLSKVIENITDAVNTTVENIVENICLKTEGEQNTQPEDIHICLKTDVEQIRQQEEVQICETELEQNTHSEEVLKLCNEENGNNKEIASFNSNASCNHILADDDKEIITVNNECVDSDNNPEIKRIQTLNNEELHEFESNLLLENDDMQAIESEPQNRFEENKSNSEKNVELRKRKVDNTQNHENAECTTNSQTVVTNNIPNECSFIQSLLFKNIENQLFEDPLKSLDFSSKKPNVNLFCRADTPSTSSTDELKVSHESSSAKKQKKRLNSKKSKRDNYVKSLGRLKNNNVALNHLAETEKHKIEQTPRTDSSNNDINVTSVPPEPLDISTFVLVSIVSSVLYLLYGMLSHTPAVLPGVEKTEDSLDAVHGRYLHLVEDWEARVLENAELDYQIALRERSEKLQYAARTTARSNISHTSPRRISLPECLCTNIIPHAFGHLRQYPPDIHDVSSWHKAKLCVDLEHLLTQMRPLSFSAVLRFLQYLASPSSELNYEVVFEHYLDQQKIYVHDLIQRDYPEVYRSNVFYRPKTKRRPAMYCLSMHRFSVLKDKYAPGKDNMQALTRLSQLYVQEETCLLATLRSDGSSIDHLYQLLLEVLLSRSIATAITLDPSLLHDYYLELILSNEENMKRLSKQLFKYNVLAMQKFNLTRRDEPLMFGESRMKRKNISEVKREVMEEADFLRDGGVLPNRQREEMIVRQTSLGIEDVELFYDSQLREISNGYSSKVRKFLNDINSELKHALCHPYNSAHVPIGKNESMVRFIRNMCRTNVLVTEQDTMEYQDKGMYKKKEKRRRKSQKGRKHETEYRTNKKYEESKHSKSGTEELHETLDLKDVTKAFTNRIEDSVSRREHSMNRVQDSVNREHSVNRVEDSVKREEYPPIQQMSYGEILTESRKPVISTDSMDTSWYDSIQVSPIETSDDQANSTTSSFDEISSSAIFSSPIETSDDQANSTTSSFDEISPSDSTSDEVIIGFDKLSSFEPLTIQKIPEESPEPELLRKVTKESTFWLETRTENPIESDIARPYESHFDNIETRSENPIESDIARPYESDFNNIETSLRKDVNKNIPDLWVLNKPNTLEIQRDNVNIPDLAILKKASTLEMAENTMGFKQNKASLQRDNINIPDLAILNKANKFGINQDILALDGNVNARADEIDTHDEPIMEINEPRVNAFDVEKALHREVKHDDLFIHEEIESFIKNNRNWRSRLSENGKGDKRKQKRKNLEERYPSDEDELRTYRYDEEKVVPNHREDRVNAYDMLERRDKTSASKVNEVNSFHKRPYEYDSRTNTYDSRTNTYDSRTNEYDSRTNAYDSKPYLYDNRPKAYDSKSNAYDNKPKVYDSKSNAYDRPKAYETRSNAYESNTEERVVHIDGNENKYSRHVFIDNVDDSHVGNKRERYPEVDFWWNRRARLRAKLRKKHYYPVQSNPEHQYDYLYA